MADKKSKKNKTTLSKKLKYDILRACGFEPQAARYFLAGNPTNELFCQVTALTLKEEQITALLLRGARKEQKQMRNNSTPQTKKHKICPFCGSKNIKEIKLLWGICFDCESNFHLIPKERSKSR